MDIVMELEILERVHRKVFKDTPGITSKEAIGLDAPPLLTRLLIRSSPSSFLFCSPHDTLP